MTESAARTFQSTGRKPGDILAQVVRRLAPAALSRRTYPAPEVSRTLRFRGARKHPPHAMRCDQAMLGQNPLCSNRLTRTQAADPAADAEDHTDSAHNNQRDPNKSPRLIGYEQHRHPD